MEPVLEPTIGRFLLFLGAELLFVLAAVIGLLVVGITIIKSGKLKPTHMIMAAVAFHFINLLFLFLVTWILSGTSFLPIFIVLAIVSVALMLFVEFTCLVAGVRNIPWAGQVIWALYEFEQTVPRISKVLKYCSIAALAVYTVYVGYGYFGAAFSAGHWPRHVMQATLVALVGFTWLTELPKNLYVITSRSIAEDTRSRIFIVQLGNSVFVMLIVSIYVWSVRGGGATVGLLGEHFVFSPAVAYVVICYLIAILIVPYLIGHYGAKEWMGRVVNELHELVDKLVKGLANPNLAKAAVTLEEAERSLQSTIDRFHEDSSLELADDMRKSVEDEKFIYRLALSESDTKDPRFVHANRLRKLMELIVDCKAQLAGKENDREKREVLDAYVKAFEKEKEARKEESAGPRPLVLGGLTAVAGAIMSLVFSSVAKLTAVQMGFGQLVQ